MSAYRLSATCLALSFALLIQSCTTVPSHVESDAELLDRYEARAAGLAGHSSWALQGRLAIRDGEDGGSGSLRWNQAPGSSRMDFHGALGRGAWRLESGDDGAELEFADGSRIHADSVEDLVRGQLGWEIPVHALSWWVRGLEAPGGADKKQLGEDGTLESLAQSGWAIEFGRYREFDGFSLPVKLTASRAERTVKLVIRNWVLDGVRE